MVIELEILKNLMIQFLKKIVYGKTNIPQRILGEKFFTKNVPVE